jgi:hypothetical protein
MVVMICGHFQLSPLSILSSSSSSSSRLNFQLLVAQWRSKFLEFPYVSAPHKNLTFDLVLKVEDRFQSQLLPCSLPPDVQYCKSNSGTSQFSYVSTIPYTFYLRNYFLIKFNRLKKKKIVLPPSHFK